MYTNPISVQQYKEENIFTATNIDSLYSLPTLLDESYVHKADLLPP